MQNKKVNFEHLGTISYQKAWDYQESIFTKLVSQRLHNKRNNIETPLPNYLLFCEHPHVYTLGKSGGMENLLLSNEELKNKEIEFFKINRGGDITYHGFGQLVGYPILDLENFIKDLHLYMRTLEGAIILTLAEYGLKSGRIDGLTGVWLDYETPIKARKICALGVRSKQWISMHGFALNISTDLNYFKNIIPCGITDKAVTSMEAELGRKINHQEVEQKVLNNISKLFEMEINMNK
jgi:lipoyl(octanoyl) transferase